VPTLIYERVANESLQLFFYFRPRGSFDPAPLLVSSQALPK
jgi:hypothetical protein